jgi:hypothetical protein
MQNEHRPLTEFELRAAQIAQARLQEKATRSKNLADSPARRPHQGRGRVMGFALVFAILVLLKSIIYFAAGPTRYQEKLSEISTNEQILDRALWAVLQPDPVTSALARVYAILERRAQAFVREYRRD